MHGLLGLFNLYLKYYLMTVFEQWICVKGVLLIAPNVKENWHKGLLFLCYKDIISTSFFLNIIYMCCIDYLIGEWNEKAVHNRKYYNYQNFKSLYCFYY